MSVRVSAVVISHDQPEWLRKTLTALESQTRPLDEIIGVDSSLSSESAAIFAEFKITPVIRRGETSFSALVAAGVSQTSALFATTNLSGSLGRAQANQIDGATETQNSWVWLLHEDSAPAPDALEKLLAAADLSPSVALLGPKHVDPEQRDLIVQQGITLTKLGGIFSLVENELDQAQHDGADDVLAVSSAASLIRNDLYRRLQGFDRHAPNFASDIDFSIRARLSGYRVVVVPSAILYHATLSLKGKRPKRWLQGSTQAAKRRAEIHLQLAYLPTAVVWLYAVLLPVGGIARALWRIASKQPNLVAVEVFSAFWGFFTIAARLQSRSKVALNRDISINELWSLRATWSMVRHRNRMQQDHIADEPAGTAAYGESTLAPQTESPLPAETESPRAGSTEWLTNAPTKRFSAAGGWFISLALIIASWQFWPTNFAATGGSLAPLSGDWLKLAGRAGASWQNNGLGLAAPSDPFNWLLAAIGGLWFVTPSLALAVVILLAKSVAFAGAWRAAGLATKRAWIKNLIGVSYALWPSLLAAQLQGRIGAILTWMALPWLVLSVAKLLSPSAGRRARARSSSWIGVSGLLFAVVALASPSAALVLCLALLFAMVVRPKRIAVLVWVPVLAVMLYAPYAFFMVVNLGRSFVIFADPGLPLDSQPQSFWQILLGLPNGLVAESSLPQGWQWVLASTSLVLIFAIFGLFLQRPMLSLALVALAVAATLVGFVVQQSWFASLDVHGSAASSNAVAALALLLAAGLSLHALGANYKKLIGSLTAVGIAATVLASIGAFGFGNEPVRFDPTAISFSDGRTVPAIVAAEAANGSNLRMLRILQTGDNRFEAQLIWPQGLQLESNSTAYRFALADGDAAKTEYQSTNALVANLVSANGANLGPALAAANVGFVLMPQQTSSDLSAALNSVGELESVGQTDFGWLWRVKSAKDGQALGSNSSGRDDTPSSSSGSEWPFTKTIQLLFILIFILLAIPGSPKRRAKNTGNIFVANDFAANDFAENGFDGAGFDDAVDDESDSGIETLPEVRRS